MIKQAFLRDFLFLWRQTSSFLYPILFLFSFTLIISFAFDGDFSKLQPLGHALLWIASFFTILLHFDSLFKEDHLEGSLELFFLGQNFANCLKLIIGKGLAHWIIYLFPLFLTLPFMFIILAIPPYQGFVTLFFIAFTSLPFMALGFFISALVINFENSALLTTIMAVPFASPLLIFALSTNISFLKHTAIGSSFYFLIGLSLFYLITCPFITIYHLQNFYNHN